jgi:hypothetical protein
MSLRRARVRGGVRHERCAAVGVAVIAPDACRTNRFADDQRTHFSVVQRAHRSADVARCYRVVAYTKPGSAVEDCAMTAAMTSATAGKRIIRHEGCAHESHSGEPYDGMAQHYRTFFC